MSHHFKTFVKFSNSEIGWFPNREAGGGRPTKYEYRLEMACSTIGGHAARSYRTDFFSHAEKEH